jgi:hypothetical protein
MSNAIRSLPKTIDILEKKYSAIKFTHLNKIGTASLPNGYALLNGNLIIFLM